MPVAFRTLCVALLLVGTAVLLAGCTHPEEEHQPATLLQTTETVGEVLYHWADGNYSRGTTGEKRGGANFTVPNTTAAIGVSFQGTFRPEGDRYARLTVRDPQNEDLLVREAYPGSVDDHGTITDLWWFQTVEPVPPGKHGLLWTGEAVQSFEFSVHGIPAGDTEVSATFDVVDRDHVLEVEISLLGWGETPVANLVAPDGTMTPIDLTGPRSVGSVELTPERGTYGLVIDTTGWGGRILMRAVQ